MIQWSSLNRAVKDVALEGYSPGERVFIVVDDYFWERVAAKIDSEPAKVSDFLAHELKESWRVALRAADNGGQSMVFPLVALQLFAAHKMRKEGDYGANAYNPRLLEILSKQGDVAWLQEQYRYYQDTTWKETQSAIEGLDYLFPIPPETSGTGRYVQYPRLHALLNEQDLNSVSHYFHEAGILPRFRYSFDEFLGTLSLPDIAQHPKASAHFRRMANDDDKHELLFEQIYRWFNKWDGNPIKIENRRGTLESKQRIRVSEPENLLTLTSNKKGDSWQIQIIDSKVKLIKNLGFSGESCYLE